MRIGRLVYWLLWLVALAVIARLYMTLLPFIVLCLVLWLARPRR